MFRVLRRAIARMFVVITSLILSAGLSSVTALAGRQYADAQPAGTVVLRLQCDRRRDCLSRVTVSRPPGGTDRRLLAGRSGADMFEVYDRGLAPPARRAGTTTAVTATSPSGSSTNVGRTRSGAIRSRARSCPIPR